MGRRNNRATTRGNAARQRLAHSAERQSRRAKYPPIPVEELVIPRGTCGRTGKLRFSADQVATALRQVRHNRAAKGSDKVEQRYYQCDACGDFHLTSRATWTPRG